MARRRAKPKPLIDRTEATEVERFDRGNMDFSRKSAAEDRDELLLQAMQLQQVHDTLASVPTWSVPVVSAQGTTTITTTSEQREQSLKRMAQGVAELHNEAKLQERRIARGAARHAIRSRQKKNSNDPRIEALRAYDPTLVQGSSKITRERLAGALRELRARGLATVGLEISTLRKAIQRARQNGRSKRRPYVSVFDTPK